MDHQSEEGNRLQASLFPMGDMRGRPPEPGGLHGLG